MAKVTITKKLVEENSQLADLLAERNIEVGSKIEQTEYDELVKLLSQNTEDTSEVIEKVDEVIEETDVVEEITEKQVYTVISVFEDKFNRSIRYEVGQEVPADFTEDRIKDLLDRKLIK